MASRATINVSLPPPMRKWIEQRAASEGYGTVSEYVRALVREEQKRAERERIDTELLAALDGPSADMTRAEWDRVRAEVRKRLSVTRKQRKSA